MPNHPILLRDRPIMKRRMTLGGPRPLPLHAVEQIKQPNYVENLVVNNDIIYRAIRNQLPGWNGFHSGGKFNLNSSAPPPPPENLNWENSQSFQRDRSSPPFRLPRFEVPDEEPVQNFQEPFYRRIQNPPLNAYRFPEPSSVFNNRNEDFERREFCNDNFGDNGLPINQRADDDFERREFRNDNFGNNLHPINQRGLETNRNYDNERPEFSDQSFENDVQPLNKRGPEPKSRGTESSDMIFTIAGFKLPYVTNELGKSAFVESRSYAVRYFKKSPDYLIRKKKTKEVPIIQHIYNEMEAVHYDDDNDIRSANRTVSRYREALCKEWTKIYRGRDYRSWDGWWKDFRNIDVDIFEQLEKFECFNVKYNFMSPGGVGDAGKLINRANLALTKNRNNYLGNMKVVHCLMDHNVLGNLAMEATAQLQDIIRSVPNHLWIYKLRCMIYVWYSYSQVIKTKKTEDKKYQMVLKEWKSPVIHWLAKQAFFELKNISKSEYPQYREINGAASKEAKK